MAQTFFGIYEAQVLNVGDGRVQVMVPDVATPMASWARVCLPPGGSIKSLQIGTTGWIMYEAGDPMYPVFMGVTGT
jgi:hypothetical protein